MTELHRVLVVGLGTIAQTHLHVLRQRRDVEVVAGVDPVAQGDGFPTYRTLGQALEARAALDLVVVATPTDTHVPIVREVVERTDAMVLAEKPLATTRAEIDLLADVADRVRVAHHFAFSPEVEWAREHATVEAWSMPLRVTSIFNDAYAGLPERRLESVVSSWVDSGPNQLSLLAAFVGACRLVSHSEERNRAVTVLAHNGGQTVLSSNWLAADTSKQTTVEYENGRQLRMDHTSMTVAVLEDGVVTQHVGYAGSAGRKEAHYLGLYDVLLTDPHDVRLGVPLAADIARVLEASRSAPAGGTRWSTIPASGS